MLSSRAKGWSTGWLAIHVHLAFESNINLRADHMHSICDQHSTHMQFAGIGALSTLVIFTDNKI